MYYQFHIFKFFFEIQGHLRRGQKIIIIKLFIPTFVREVMDVLKSCNFHKKSRSI